MYTVLEIEFENEDEYYAIMNNIERFLDEDIRVFSVDRDKPAVIFEREPDMIAEHEVKSKMVLLLLKKKNKLNPV